MFFNRKKKEMNVFLEEAKVLGLRNEDAINAEEFIKYNEYKLSFEVIIEQLYEYEIEITKEFYLLTTEVADRLKINETEFICLKELIRDAPHVP